MTTSSINVVYFFVLFHFLLVSCLLLSQQNALPLAVRNIVSNQILSLTVNNLGYSAPWTPLTIQTTHSSLFSITCPVPQRAGQTAQTWSRKEKEKSGKHDNAFNIWHFSYFTSSYFLFPHLSLRLVLPLLFIPASLTFLDCHRIYIDRKYFFSFHCSPFFSLLLFPQQAGVIDMNRQSDIMADFEQQNLWQVASFEFSQQLNSILTLLLLFSPLISHLILSSLFTFSSPPSHLFLVTQTTMVNY